jgi:tetratricopeptide (TPR) repeat protein
METLKKTTLHLLLFFMGIFPGLSLKAQGDTKLIENAFESSYSLETKGEYANAVSAIKAVYNENSYEINLRLGWLSYRSGMFMESSAYYQKAIRLKPYAVEAKFGFAYPASAMGNWDQVVTQYQEILKIDPQNTLANYRMGSIAYGKNDFSAAEKFLEKVVNLYPFDYDSNILYAWTNYKLGKLREAQVLFHKVLLIKPKDSSALEGLGLIT